MFARKLREKDINIKKSMLLIDIEKIKQYTVKLSFRENPAKLCEKKVTVNPSAHAYVGVIFFGASSSLLQNKVRP